MSLKVIAGAALAFAGLFSSAAQAAVTLNKFYNAQLYESAFGEHVTSARSDTFNLSSYLSDASGNEYRITSATLSIAGYSDQYFNYNRSSNAIYYSEGHEVINGTSYYVRTRTDPNYVWRDDIADTMEIETSAALGSTAASQQKISQLNLVEYFSDFSFPNNLYRVREYRYESAIYGAMNFSSTVTNADLLGLNEDGQLDFTVTATLGQFRLRGASLTFERELIPATAAPEPGAWALMILGFGGAGAALRRRRAAAMS
ncbi:MAG: hypothetical protein A2790_10705 [Phenylobacterium sp. RIFCSPHIGHO2_01_FULL_69_31]|uniref:PEPxxWA-CTERM sorting domain-containing protein n=1 Tax=Phenylobacterium sp. RIFCSPHIGHO2_01_FULL_69_31 TaxID=1801944 RepID=UPI0008C2C98E|nr:PEPxxWA-CTERM sorting domain-containing protein [Phenylobacterium sp. RIFCSPHIGHO2_01_FULL_69_31]OHB31112.1 MAG: hypothetical protein A2790_10705 [Phenylobacterium sp. RIFCSPHIGHO2_01_FULL_69_31]